MTLEDTAGDVVRKARQTANVTLESAARAAGLSEADYTNFEESGKGGQQANLIAVAHMVGLDGKKLRELAGGWLPARVDLATWRELRQITTSQSGMSVNCYLIWDEVTREAALFDTGFEAVPILKAIDEEQLQLRHLFITHTHHDHIAALDAIRERYPKLKIHTSAKAAPPEQRNRSNDFIHLGSLRLTNRDTPGHADDGVTYIIGTWPDDAPNVAIVGDAIFAGSIGGAREQGELAKRKIREQIFTLPPATLLCPGHGPVTTVGQELAHNPFFL